MFEFCDVSMPSITGLVLAHLRWSVEDIPPSQTRQGHALPLQKRCPSIHSVHVYQEARFAHRARCCAAGRRLLPATCLGCTSLLSPRCASPPPTPTSLPFLERKGKLRSLGRSSGWRNRPRQLQSGQCTAFVLRTYCDANVSQQPSL